MLHEMHYTLEINCQQKDFFPHEVKESRIYIKEIEGLLSCITIEGKTSMVLT